MEENLVFLRPLGASDFIRGYYYSTAKNAMVREFYASFGFEKVEETEDGSTTWQLDVSAYQPKHPHMKIKR